jgi:P4 family phage/plasmid primase-like protien
MTQTVSRLEDIPAIQTLIPGKQWVCYTANKVPYQPGNGEPAKANDPATWGDYDLAVKAWKVNSGFYAGIGREFIKEQRTAGVDIDKCITDGQIEPWAQAIIDRLNSYTELSPSGKGVHIWLYGSIPDNIGADPDGISKIEMYDHERYFTVTGKHLAGTPTTLEERQEELTTLHAEVRQAREQAKRAKHTTREKNVSTGPDSPYGMAALKEECRNVALAREGGRNQQLNVSAFALGQLIGGGALSRSTVERDLFFAAQRSGLPENEIEKTMRSGLEAGMLEPRTAPAPKLPGYEPIDTDDQPASNGSGNHSNNGYTTIPDGDTEFILDCLQQGEWGDSLLFAQLFRGKAVYDHTEKEWYLYRRHAWVKDALGKVTHLVSGKLAGVYIRIAGTLIERAREGNDQAEKDRADKHAKALLKRALELRSVARCKNVLTFATSQDDMGITAEKWDRNKWLLACPNGVLDLKIGERRPGNPQDYIRTTCPTEWQGLQTPAPRFERFLSEIFEDRSDQERTEVINFLQRLSGYGITGETREHIFTVLYGEDGRNGKDTLQRAYSHALGQASGAISKDVLLDAGRQHTAGGATPHLCDLQGKRLAWANEPEKGARFNVGQVKDLSGGGEIPVRPLYAKDYYKIQPTHLLILLTNHKPHADANDSAFWDRLRLITFNMRFVDNPTPNSNERKKDTALWEALEQEAPGILAWLVRGCLQWQTIGLATPKCILDAGNAYRKEEDTIGIFIEERCNTKNPLAETQAKLIYDAYNSWCDAGNMKKLNSTNFGRLLGKRFHKETKYNGVIYYGIELLPIPSNSGSTLNSLQNPSGYHESASQATEGGYKASKPEGSEGFLQEVGKTTKDTYRDESLSVKTIQTIQDTSQGDSLKQPIKPVESILNSLQNPSGTIQDEEMERRKKRGRILSANLQQPGETKEAYTARIDALLREVS